MKIIDVIAQVFSTLFSPLLIPTYCVIFALCDTYLYSIPNETKWNSIMIVFAITAAVPLIGIYLLTRFRIVDDPGLNRREERLYPYILTFLCYLGTALYMKNVHAPAWLSLFMLGGAAANLINFLVNFKWKISSHGAAMGGLIAVILYIAYKGYNVWPIEIWLFIAILLTGIVCTSRLILRRHTLMQITAGVACGFACVYLAMLMS